MNPCYSSKLTSSEIVTHTLTTCMPMVRVFANSPGDQGSVPGPIIPKTQKKCHLILP